jgi:uncharacterized protein
MYKRYLTEKIATSLAEAPVILLNGARQVGKSTLCKSLIEEGIFQATYLTMDDPVLLGAAASDPMGFLLDQPDLLIIDEIQRVPELFISLKKLIDDDRQKRRVILSGSANVLALPKLADSLAGRMEIYDLWPLSQDEIRGEKSNFLDVLLSPNDRFQDVATEWKEIAETLSKGGYPESLSRKTFERRVDWFESYVRSILQKDIHELTKIEGLREIPDILRMIALRVGSTLNMTSISGQVGVKHTTFRRYLTLLQNIFLLTQLPAWTTNVEGRFVKSPKIYINDTGLLSYLMGDLDNDDLYARRNTAGSALENFVVMEIVKQATWHRKRLKLFHFSIHQGAEVDIVIEQGPMRVYGIEVKSAATVSKENFKGLKKLKELSKDRFQKGIILYTGNKAVSFGQDLKAVPLAALWAPVS